MALVVGLVDGERAVADEVVDPALRGGGFDVEDHAAEDQSVDDDADVEGEAGEEGAAGLLVGVLAC